MSRVERSSYTPLLLAILGGFVALRLAINAYGVLPLHGDEAQYWTYAEHPGFGYYSKPPMLPWLIALFTAVLGDTPFGIRALSPVLHAVAAFGVFAAGRTLFSAAVGFWAAVLYLTLPGISWSALMASTDVPMLTGWALALFALTRARAHDGPAYAWWIFAGISLGFAMLGKYTGAAFIGSLLLYLLVSAEGRARLGWRGPLAGMAALLLTLSPNLWWNLNNRFATVTHLSENASIERGSLVNPDNMLEFLGEQFAVFGPLSFALLLMFLLGARPWRDDRLRLLWCFIAPLLLVMTVQAFLSRANANWAAPIYLAGCVAVASLSLTRGWKRLLTATVVVNLALSVALVGLTAVHAAPYPSSISRAFDPFRKQRGIEVQAEMLAPVLAAHPDALLLMDQRMEMASVLHATGLPLARSIKWDQDGVAQNWYEMVTSLPDDPARSYIYATTRRSPDGVTAQFANVTEQPPIVVQTHPDRETVMRVFLLSGYRGSPQG